MNSTHLVNYPLPPDGITIKAESTSANCRIQVFGSTFVTVPNEALNDIQIFTDSTEDAFLDTSTIFNKDTASRLYLAIKGSEEFPCAVRISAEEGDSAVYYYPSSKIIHSGVLQTDTMSSSLLYTSQSSTLDLTLGKFIVCAWLLCYSVIMCLLHNEAMPSSTFVPSETSGYIGNRIGSSTYTQGNSVTFSSVTKC